MTDFRHHCSMDGLSPFSYTHRVALGTRSYDIHIEPGCLNHLGAVMCDLFPEISRCMVVSNETVAPLYLHRIRQSLTACHWHVDEHILPDGEQYKNVTHWNQIMDAMMRARLSRHEPVMALGGGVVGDMAGFAAACYRRGVPYVQIPTTLLAQVDSSVGGKTAVNHPRGKNMIGAFYQPRLVWIDPRVLQTLESRELRAGIVEAIKYGLIRDVVMFDYLNANMTALLALDADTISDTILGSCRHKAEVVMADETEQGNRALLNLGHTFGHAIEAMTHYTAYLHGEGVALGTLMAARLSEQSGHAAPGLENKIRALYKKVGLPVKIPSFPLDAWLDTMEHDKKNVGRRIRFILLKDIGDALIAEDIQTRDIRQLIRSYT